MSLPTTMKGLILQEDSSLTLTHDLPFPSSTPGSLTIRVLANFVDPHFVHLLRGTPGVHPFTQPRPLIPGADCIGRIVDVGPDAVSLKVGQLVFVDIFVKARDDPDTSILRGLHDGYTEASKKLYKNAWRDASYAEYMRAPLENAFPLDEELLCSPVAEGGFGYSIPDLLHFIPHAVPYGGLRNINLQPGETVIISPATGLFSGSAVAVALAMGANVIAASRSPAGLAKLNKNFPSCRTVELTGDTAQDTAAIAAASGKSAPDAFLDLSPPASTGSNGVTVCMSSLKPGGRIALMGARYEANIPLPWTLVVYSQLTIKGCFMYERNDIRQLIRLLESGKLKLGEENGYEIVSTFALEEWGNCADAAVEHTSFGRAVVLAP